MVNESALLAVRDHSTVIARHHLDEAVERVQGARGCGARIISEDEKARIACHEPGHAVVAAVLAAAVGKARAVEKVAVVARGRRVGHLAVQSSTPTGWCSPSPTWRRRSRWPWPGPFEMSRHLGRVRVLFARGELFLGRDYLAAGDASQPTHEHLDAEARPATGARGRIRTDDLALYDAPALPT